MKRIFTFFLMAVSFGSFAAEDVPADYIPDDMPVIPQGVYVTAPQSAQEGAIGTTDQYGNKFDLFIMRKYPDLKKIKYDPDQDIRDDKESLDVYTTSFYRALYFSKLVTLSDGKNLYNYLTTCAKLNRTVTTAMRGSVDTNQFDIQYYLELRKADDGSVVGESIYLKRDGNKFYADRTPFSYFVISDENFMKTFGLKCYK